MRTLNRHGSLSGLFLKSQLVSYLRYCSLALHTNTYILRSAVIVLCLASLKTLFSSRTRKATYQYGSGNMYDSRQNNRSGKGAIPLGEMGMNFVSVNGGEVRQGFPAERNFSKPNTSTYPRAITPDSDSDEDKRHILDSSYKNTKGVHVEKHYHVSSDPVEDDLDWRKMP
jgi:hypothetical protein